MSRSRIRPTLLLLVSIAVACRDPASVTAVSLAGEWAVTPAAMKRLPDRADRAAGASHCVVLHANGRADIVDLPVDASTREAFWYSGPGNWLVVESQGDVFVSLRFGAPEEVAEVIRLLAVRGSGAKQRLRYGLGLDTGMEVVLSRGTRGLPDTLAPL